MTSRNRTPSISVAIPCFNEAAAIASVVREWRAALPEAEIIVFDNASTDGSAGVARKPECASNMFPNEARGTSFA